MKKALLWLMTVVCLSALLICPASALRGDDVEPLSWDDCKPYFEPDGGRFIKFYQVGLMVWMSNSYQPVDLTRQDINDGVIGYYLLNGGEPYGMEVIYRVTGAENRDEYEREVLASGGTNVLFTTINGRPGMIFDRSGPNAVCAALVDDFGGVTEFRFFPASSDGFYYDAQNMICSIQPIS